MKELEGQRRNIPKLQKSMSKGEKRRRICGQESDGDAITVMEVPVKRRRRIIRNMHRPHIKVGKDAEEVTHVV